MNTAASINLDGVWNNEADEVRDDDEEEDVADSADKEFIDDDDVDDDEASSSSDDDDTYNETGTPESTSPTLSGGEDDVGEDDDVVEDDDDDVEDDGAVVPEATAPPKVDDVDSSIRAARITELRERILEELKGGDDAPDKRRRKPSSLFGPGSESTASAMLDAMEGQGVSFEDVVANRDLFVQLFLATHAEINLFGTKAEQASLSKDVRKQRLSWFRELMAPIIEAGRNILTPKQMEAVLVEFVPIPGDSSQFAPSRRRAQNLCDVMNTDQLGEAAHLVAEHIHIFTDMKKLGDDMKIHGKVKLPWSSWVSFKKGVQGVVAAKLDAKTPSSKDPLCAIKNANPVRVPVREIAQADTSPLKPAKRKLFGPAASSPPKRARRAGGDGGEDVPAHEDTSERDRLSRKQKEDILTRLYGVPEKVCNLVLKSTTYEDAFATMLDPDVVTTFPKLEPE